MQLSASTFYETWPAAMNTLKAAPNGGDIAKAFGPFFQAIMRDSSADGGLSAKHKELIALGIGIASRCEACIYTHVEKCLKVGATPREVMDVAGVAIMMGGGPAYTHAALVAAALKHWEGKSAGH